MRIVSCGELVVVVFLSVFCAVTRTAAVTFYVDDENGNDTAKGTSDATAWQTLQAVNKAKLFPGDKVLFKRGGLWRGQLIPQSGNEQSRVYYGAYGKGPKPILEQSVCREKPTDWEEFKPSLWATRSSRPTLREKLSSDFPEMKWDFSFQDDAKGTCTRMTEGDCTFNRLTYVKGAHKSHQIQLWGPTIPVIPDCMVLKIRMRATHPFDIRTVRIMDTRAPWTTASIGRVVDGPMIIGPEWKTLEYRLMKVHRLSNAKLQFSIGETIPENTVFDFSVVELWDAKCSLDYGLPFDIGNLILDHGEKWGVKKWAIAELTQPLDYLYDSANRRIVVKCDQNPASAFKSIELAQTRHVVAETDCHDVTYEGLTIRYTGSHGFGGANTRNITIRLCDICWIGGGLQFFYPNGRPVRYGNGIEFGGDVRGILVEKCRLWEIYDAALTNQGRGNEPGEADEFDITYRDNVIWNAEYSFECWNGPEFSKLQRITFEHNTCVNAGFGWGHNQRPQVNGAHLMFYDNRAETKDFIVRNNIFCNTTEYNTRMMSDWRSGLTMDNNLYYMPDKPIIWWLNKKKYLCSDFAVYQQELQMDLHSIYAAPEFVDAANHDYRLKSGTVGTALASDGGPVGARQ